ncbi:MAG: acyltransferase, partial [bacterium]|nr:acyltransferase [bacterium]
MTQRYAEIDYIKVFGILAVILIHSVRPIWNPHASVVEQFVNAELRFAVPGFLFCSGFLYAHTRALDWRVTLSRLRRIGIPYLVASVGAEIYQAVHRTPRTPAEIAYDLSTGNAFAHYYYVFVIVVLVIATPVFARFSTRGIAVFTAVVVAIHGYLVVGDFVPGGKSLSFIPAFWQFRLPLLWWSFFLFGWVARQHYDVIRQWITRSRWKLVCGLSILWAGFAWAQLAPVLPVVAKLTSWLQVFTSITLIGVSSCGASKIPRPVRLVSDATYGI